MKDGWTGLAVLFVAGIAIAYFAGQSNGASTTATSAPVQPEVTNTMTPNTVSDTSVSLTAASDNGLACKKIANEAVTIDNQSRSGSTVTLLRPHFNQNLNQCYYEVYIIGPGSTQTNEIRVAPDDSWVAYCSVSDGLTICNERNHKGLETQDQFHSLESYYLTN